MNNKLLKQITHQLINEYEYQLESYNELLGIDLEVALIHLEKSEDIKQRILNNIEEIKK